MPLPKIPKEDKELINKAFSGNKKANIITKKARGEVVSKGDVIINPQGYVIKNYSGKISKA